jgi:hypothetical protein
VSILVDMFYEFLFVIHSISILSFYCFVFFSKSGITSNCGFSLFGLMLWFLCLLITIQEDDYISGGKLSTFIFLEEDLTMLSHYPHRTNQGSISFFHSYLFLLLHLLYRTLGTMFGLSVERCFV